jgi:hypothetical protein
VSEAALDLARSHVTDAKRFVKRQRVVVAELTRRGDDQRTLDAAHALLRELTVWRRLAERHLEQEKAMSRELQLCAIRSHLVPGKIFWPPDEAPLDGPSPSIEESSRRAIARSRALLSHSQ